MKAYQELSKEELLTLKAELNAAYEDAKGKGLKLICPEENRQLTSWI